METETLEMTRTVKAERTVTINRPVEELYRFWRNLENLPRIMENLESVSTTGGNQSHWVAKGPGDARIEWDARIVNEIENELIEWESLEGSEVTNAGSVYFKKAPGDRGTEVKVILHYEPPGGGIGAGIAKFFGEEPSQQIREDLCRFKQLMETGEIPTIKGQSAGAGRG